MGNCTATNLVYHSAGDEKKVDLSLTLSASYATGGDTLTAAQLGMALINRIEISNEKGYFFEPDIASSKLSALIKAYTGGNDGFTPAGTNSTSAVTGTAAAQTFTGSTPYATENVSVTFDAAPDGNQIYVKFNNDGTPYLACNMATDTADKWLTFTAQGGKIMIKHDASASSGGFGLTINAAAAPTDKLIADLSTACNTDVYLPTTAGRLVIIKNAGSGGVALHFDDGADERLEANLSPASDTTFSCNTQGWITVTPSGTNGASASLTATAAAQTFTGTAVPAGAGDEVANGTDLTTTPGAITVSVYGY